MPIYKVIEVDPGGSGGCLSPLLGIAFAILVVSALADSCRSSTSEVSNTTTSTEVRGSTSDPSSDQAHASKSETPADPEPESAQTPAPSPEPEQQEQERTLQEQYVNGWVLERLREENRPVALIAMYGSTPFESRLVKGLRRRGVNAQAGLLKQIAFETDALLQRLEGGDSEILRSLGLARLSGHLVLCRLSFSEIQETKDGYTTQAYLSVVLVPLKGGRPVRREFEAPGGGFDPADAEEQARERVRSDFLGSSIASKLTRR